MSADRFIIPKADREPYTIDITDSAMQRDTRCVAYAKRALKNEGPLAALRIIEAHVSR